jgi:hypothetical protein
MTVRTERQGGRSHAGGNADPAGRH